MMRARNCGKLRIRRVEGQMLAAWLAQKLAQKGIFYGWIVVATTFLISLSTAAMMGLVGVLILPFEAEFGWTATDIGGPLGLRLVLYGLTAPFAAAFISRYGVRRMVALALILIVSGVLLSTQMTQLWQLWITWGVMAGFGTGLTAMVLGATVASRWFTARRGLVTGLLMAANATGQLLFLPFAAWLANHYGWRFAVLPGLLICCIAWGLNVLFGCEFPADLGLPPFGEHALAPRPPRPTGNPFARSLTVLGEASASPTFWMLFLTFFVCGLSTAGLVQTHFIPFCSDQGVAVVTAASILAMMGAFDFVGTIGSGWLTDRFDSRKLLFMYYGLRGLSLIALPYTDFSVFGLSIFAVFYGLDWIATVPPTVRIAAQEFGRDKGPMVFGWAFCAHQLGGAVAASMGAVIKDGVGSYQPAFMASGVACLIAAGMALWLRGSRRPALA
jgi:MFS family permease